MSGARQRETMKPEMRCAPLFHAGTRESVSTASSVWSSRMAARSCTRSSRSFTKAAIWAGSSTRGTIEARGASAGALCAPAAAVAARPQATSVRVTPGSSSTTSGP